MYGYIYKRVNVINGMVYVGQHVYHSKEVKLDESYRGSGVYFNRALEYFGEENFTYELIDTAEDKDELNEKEKFWIKELNSIETGYNLTSGGSFVSPEDISFYYRLYSNMGMKGKKQSQYQKTTASEYMKNREITDEFRNNCSKAKVGNTNAKGNKGCFWITNGTEEHKIHSEEELEKYPGYYPGRLTDVYSKISRALTEEERIYVHKDETEKYIKKKELRDYQEKGFVVGKIKSRYQNRGASISEAKKGKIRIMNTEGKIKYISKDVLNEYLNLGFYPTKPLI